MKLLITSFRTLGKFGLYTIVNILGLTISIACVIIITRFVHQETTVNGFVPELNQIYLMTVEHQNSPPRLGGAGNPNRDADYKDPLKDVAVETYSRFITFVDDQVVVNEHQFKANVLVADSVFLQLIPYPVLQGSDKLSAPTDAIITSRFAKRVFGNQNPIGKKIMHGTGKTLTIVGVLGEPSTKSGFDFDVIANIAMHKHWMRIDYNIVKLHQGTDYKQVNKEYSDFKKYSHIGLLARYQLFPLNELYFNTSISLIREEEILQKGNRGSIMILSVVAVLILFVGLFNFINIFTVVTLRRAREFGIKKVYGAKPWQIFMQIYLENFLQAAIALFLAWFFLEVFGKILLNSFALHIVPNVRFDVWLSIGLLFLLPLLTSLYPFFRFNFSKPVTSLRSVNVGGVSLVSRSAFLIMQYVITFGLMMIALFFMKQLHFMLNADLGYDAKNVVVAKLLHRDNSYEFDNVESHKAREQRMKERIQIITEKMNGSPLFDEWMFGDPKFTVKPFVPMQKSGENEFKSVALVYMSIKQMNMFNYQLLEGRLWDSTDVALQYRFIINETAKKTFAISDIHNEYLQPERRLWMNTQMDMSTNPAYEIVGVIKDFNTGHLSQATAPVVISFDEDMYYENLVARVVQGKEREAIEFLKKLNTELYGYSDFEYAFWDDKIAGLYKEDKRVSRIYVTFAIIAILISCLGLFALSLFDIRQRYREIALRKINGATAKDIRHLLLKKYVYLLAIAFVIAVPLVFFVISKYMESFVHRTAISWWLFAISAIIVAAISLITLLWQIKKAMKVNPARVFGAG